jgi:hypothetical protein
MPGFVIQLRACAHHGASSPSPQASGMPGFVAQYDGLIDCLVDTVR